MQLPGRLDGTTLGDLLGALHRDGATGILELLENDLAGPGQRHRVHLHQGKIYQVESSYAVRPLGEILLRQGLITREAFRSLGVKLYRYPGARVGRVLVAEGLSSEAIVEAAIRLQTRQRLELLYGIRGAQVHFHVASRDRSGWLRAPLGQDEFLRGRPRRRDYLGESDTRRQRWVPPNWAATSDNTAPRASATPPGASSWSAGSDSAGPRKAAPRPTPGPRAKALAVLGLGDGASTDEARRAFRRWAAQHHPDRFPTASPTEREALASHFARVSAAYHELVA